MEIRKADVTGHWVHSFEEDDENGIVYRPQGHKLPRARGRAALELKQDGTSRYIGIGRGDRPDVAEGTWTLEQEKGRPRIRICFTSGETMDLPVVSATTEKLVIAPE
jgi:hypothetical protein